MSERHGIEIDYCPKCRGVWLDRGELDKIVERATQGALPSSDGARQSYPGPHHTSSSHPGHHKKKESFLGDLFDF